jgi:hypothetical protein
MGHDERPAGFNGVWSTFKLDCIRERPMAGRKPNPAAGFAVAETEPFEF